MKVSWPNKKDQGIDDRILASDISEFKSELRKHEIATEEEFDRILDSVKKIGFHLVDQVQARFGKSNSTWSWFTMEVIVDKFMNPKLLEMSPHLHVAQTAHMLPWQWNFFHELVHLVESYHATGGQNWNTNAVIPNSEWSVLIDESATPKFRLTDETCYENPFPEFLNYERLFRHRGGGYHEAMLASPNARDEEFKAVVSELSEFLEPTKYSDLKPDEQILLVDLPSGGNYLSRFLPSHVAYKGLEVTKFTNDTSEIVSWSSLPFPDNSVHVVATVAALHHLSLGDRAKYYSEVLRVLHPEGVFLIADVVKGSKVDKFLNIFVAAWNSHGHEGLFFNATEESEVLQNAGFSEVRSNVRQYPWKFHKGEEMRFFMKNLFGLDKATKKKTLAGISRFLTINEQVGELQLEWELIFFAAMKKSNLTTTELK
jgi:SAM-dependent methyltransferase